MAFDFKTVSGDAYQIIEFEGDLMDKYAAQGVIEHLEKELASGCKTFILSLKNLRFMNSTGINIIISMLTKARNNGGEVMICEINEKVKELLVITKLNTVFTVYASREEAINHTNQ
jgi:anti-sigma B factor antagonist